MIRYLKYYYFKKISLAAFFALFVLFVIPQTVFAITIPESQQIPGVKYTNLSEFLSSLYIWGISIVGVLTFAQLVRGGLMYMVSGAVDQKSAAKGIITDALIGLALALTSFLILNFVNPKIAEVEEVKLEPVEMLETPTTGEAEGGEGGPVVLPDAGNAGLCLSYTELQNYIDADYTCDLTGGITCSSGKSAYLCLAPTTVPPCSVANADSQNCVGSDAQENTQFYAPTYTAGEYYKISGSSCPSNYYGKDYVYGDIPVGCILIRYDLYLRGVVYTYVESEKINYEAHGYHCSSQDIWLDRDRNDIEDSGELITKYTCEL